MTVPQYAGMIYMPPPKSPLLSYIGFKVWSSLLMTLERAADQKVTMTHVVITALAVHLRRAGYFRLSPNRRTAKRNKRCEPA